MTCQQRCRTRKSTLLMVLSALSVAVSGVPTLPTPAWLSDSRSVKHTHTTGMRGLFALCIVPLDLALVYF